MSPSGPEGSETLTRLDACLPTESDFCSAQKLTYSRGHPKYALAGAVRVVRDEIDHKDPVVLRKVCCANVSCGFLHFHYI